MKSMNVKELKKIMQEHSLHGYSHYDKQELIELLMDKGILSEKPQKKKDYEKPRTKRKSPQSVKIRDIKTGETTIYSSIYKAAKALKINPGLIIYYDGKDYKGLYDIKII